MACNKHYLCKTCLNLITPETREAYFCIIACSECQQKIAFNLSSDQENQILDRIQTLCLECHEDKSCIDLCRKHFYCKDCIPTLNIDSCKSSLKERCNQCINEFNTTIEKIKIPGCELDHYYCENCCNEELLIKNPDYCKYCSEYLSSKFKNLLIQKCKNCRSREICVTLNCKDRYCIKCIKYYEKSVLNIENCVECSEMYQQSCRKCFALISDSIKRIVNPTCKLNHFYCKECFNELVTLKGKQFCDSCEDLYYRSGKDDKCLLCDKPLENAFTKTCSLHKICEKCINLINKESKQAYFILIKCEECRSFIIAYPEYQQSAISNLYPIEKSQNISANEKYCIKCNENKICIDLCNKHSYCAECISNLNTNSFPLNCDNCESSLKERCNKCMNKIDTTMKKIKIPKCSFEHQYCETCYNGGLLIDNLNLCTFCKEYLSSIYNKLLIQECKYCKYEKICVTLNCKHRYCIECINKPALEIGDCHDCKEMIEKSCKNCFVLIPSPSNRIKNPYCELNHFYCASCFTDLALRRDDQICSLCSKLYDSNQENNCCWLCDDTCTANTSKNSCINHKLCDKCFKLITEESIQAYRSIIRCGDCQEIIYKNFKNQSHSHSSFLKQDQNLIDSIVHSIPNSDPNKIEENYEDPSPYQEFPDNESYKSNPDISDDTSHENTRFQNNILCKNCNTERPCVNLQCEHRYCIICIKFENISVKLSQCQDCKIMNEQSCRNCFINIENMNSRIINPFCKEKHFYCSKCFIDETNLKNPEYCKYCKKLYNMKSSSVLCLLCNNLPNNKTQYSCKKHRLCQKCFELINDQSILAYFSIIECEDCQTKILEMTKINSKSNLNIDVQSSRRNTYNPSSYSNQIVLDDIPNDRSHRNSSQLYNNYPQQEIMPFHTNDSAVPNPSPQGMISPQVEAISFQVNNPDMISDINLRNVNNQVVYPQNSLPSNNKLYYPQEYNQAGYNNSYNAMPISSIEEKRLNYQNPEFINLPQYNYPQVLNYKQKETVRAISNRNYCHGGV